MARVILQHITKKFGDFTAVKDFSAEAKDGEFITLLGPSGCGKTTTLRMVAGFIEPTQGAVIIGENTVTSTSKGIFVSPEERNIGMVFQTYAVWPHMNILDNVSYPLKIRKVNRRKRYDKAEEALKMVRLEGMGKRYPHQLSGGQQQRVALARALIVEPDVMLLDEPLSNLDAKLREQMRFEIKELQRRTGVTIIYVTHDQAEAMAMSDRIIVMNQGEIQQVGKPEDIYERPANKFVASFIGLTNLIPCRVGEDREHLLVRESGVRIKYPVPGRYKGEVMLSVRPEDITIVSRGEGVLEGRVVRATYLGSMVDYLVRAADTVFRVQEKEQRFTEGEMIALLFEEEKMTVF